MIVQCFFLHQLRDLVTLKYSRLRLFEKHTRIMNAQERNFEQDMAKRLTSLNVSIGS